MFFTTCGPRSRKRSGRSLRTCSCTAPEMQTPPGCARAWRRAAMFTPSPNRSPPFTITSPACTPMRNSSRRSAGSLALAFASRSCVSTAHCTASTALGNSASTPSPAVLTMRPPCSAMMPSMICRRSVRLAERADLIQSHQPSVARHVRRQDGGELARDSLVRIGHDRQCLWTSGCLSWSAGLHSAGRSISKRGEARAPGHEASLDAPVG